MWEPSEKSAKAGWVGGVCVPPSSSLLVASSALRLGSGGWGESVREDGILVMVHLAFVSDISERP